MRIGVAALGQLRGGVLEYLGELLRDWRAGAGSRHEIVLYASGGTLGRLPDHALDDTIAVRCFPSADRGVVGRLVLEARILPHHLRRDGIDVLFSPASTLPWRAPVPCVATFHTAAPVCPGMTIGRLGPMMWARVRYTGRAMRRSATQATAVIFLSEYVRDHYVRHGVIPQERAWVVRHGLDPLVAGARHAPAASPPYVLTVSHLYPYKNLEQLVGGFAEATRGAFGDYELWIAGGDPIGGAHERLERAIEHAGVKDRVRLLGAVDRQAIGRLLASASIFAFSSTCENCPIALMEALSAGLPVASSNLAAMPEIAGDAALYFDPHRPDDIARSLTRLMSDPELAATLSSRALTRAAAFPSPADVAARTLDVLEHACNGGRS